MERFNEEVLKSIFHWDTDGKIIPCESFFIEYKLSFNLANIDKYIKLMSGLANNKGGYIIFGVNDETRKLVGLAEESIAMFNKIDSNEFRGAVLSTCSPNVEYQRYLHIIDTKTFGVLYVEKIKNKPCIISTNRGDLKEGDIYYRFNDSVTKIDYAQLSNIIEEKRIQEQKKWMTFLGKIAKIGIDNVIMIDCKNGQMISPNGSNNIEIGADLIKELKLVDEGHFVENDGLPTLKLIGKLIGKNIEFTTDETTTMYNTADYYKYDLGMLQRKIDNENVMTNDGFLTKDFDWKWPKIRLYVENNKLKENALYCLKNIDEENRKGYRYSIKLFDDMKNFIETHTKEELVNYKLIKEVTNE
ncbi:MAG: ATP-binding protein [Bacilli bacterium]